MKSELANDIAARLKELQDKKLYGHFSVEFNFQNGVIKNINYGMKESKLYESFR